MATSVVLMVIGQGLTVEIKKQAQELGANLVVTLTTLIIYGSGRRLK